MIKGRNILITGSNGFIGKNLNHFYSQNNTVIEYSKDSDWTVEEVINQKNTNIDIIINCAADIYNPSEMFESNVVLLNRILSCCVDKSNIKIVQIGSSSEYGEKKNKMSEKDVLEPRTMYEGTKAAATMLAVGYAREYGVDVCVVRPFSIYGLHEKEFRFFPTLMRHFLNRERMTVTKGYHDFVYIKDFVRAIDIILNSEKEKTCGDIINVGSGHQLSNFDIVWHFEESFEKYFDGEIGNDFVKKFETNNWICDPNHAFNKYNFSTNYSMQSGINDYIKEYKKYYGITI